MKNPVAYTVLGLIVGSLAILVLSPWIGWSVLPPFILGLMFFSGIAYFFGTYFYLKAIQTEEASRVSILLNIIPLFNISIIILSFFIIFFFKSSLVCSMSWILTGEITSCSLFLKFL